MQALGSANSLPLAMLVSAVYSPGRVSIPVPKNQVIYASFEHVAGVAASEGYTSSVDKLQILNTLIDRLIKMREEPLAAKENAGRPSPERIDALLAQYSKEAHALANRTGPYTHSLGLTPGSLISIAA